MSPGGRLLPAIFCSFLFFVPQFCAESIIDKICAGRNSSEVFCQRYHANLRDSPPANRNVKIVRIAPDTARRARDNAEVEDPSCGELKLEYDQICFAMPPVAAFKETKAFCDAFIASCSHTLKNNFFTDLKEIHVDYTAYCKKQKERFRYVCPDPVRFHSYAEEALEFCLRYKDRCPDVEVPSEPVHFRDPMEGHIYTREIEFICTRNKRWAYNYCTEPALLKVPKYAIPCALYKYQCVDVYSRVIYGWGK